jgi:hypothetical protein
MPGTPKKALQLRAKKLARETDFGRRYGWFIERDGERIGELDYIRWDSLAQFWHEYSIVWHKVRR